MFDDPQVTLEEGCPKEFEDREDSWVWLCGHFQEPDYVDGGTEEGGSKFPKIHVFADVYVWPRDELTKSLHVNMVDKG
ncbi:hypothetical protein D8674_004085 [Pyrus ussuriensis x Pyrus communis]|uniref:Uncharacterized protein n=1 Tax=Pyrus ussuriensis x Pyrus communis TaxID=2448454 RepID=A0A5N5FP34_9ROSA|nr:hypothetical protein D8674_004085 [Pyrus ussuriensis x Pyrus communis]